MSLCSLTFFEESWQIAQGFSISRGTKTHAKTILVTLATKDIMGRGEMVPYGRYDETITSVCTQLQTAQNDFQNFTTHQEIATYIANLPPGSARNGLDCAYIDLLLKTKKQSAPAYFSLPPTQPCATAYTISLGEAHMMASQAVKAAQRFSLIKLKLGAGDGHDGTRIKTIRAALPDTRLIIDANEGWTVQNVEPLCQLSADLNIDLIEQPLPQVEDEFLKNFEHKVPLCADESFKTSADLQDIAGKYEVVNIKLDKTGGLTEAVKAAHSAKAQGFDIMIGCMVSTSLAIAPIMALTPFAQWVDLDAPALLTSDRDNGLYIDSEGLIHPPQPSLWG